MPAVAGAVENTTVGSSLVGDGACRAKALTDPAPWEESLPGADVSTALRATDAGCVTEVRRDAESVVWRNPDDTLTGRLYSTPVNFKSSDGSWRAIDTRLKRDGDGFVTTAGPVTARFASSASASSLVRLEADKSSLSFGFDGFVGVDGELQAPPASSSATVGAASGADAITYPDVARNVDLRYQVLSQALKEVVMVRAPLADGATPELVFSVQLSGLRARTADDGTVEFIGDDGTVRFRVPRGIAFDASGNPDPENGRPAATTPVDVKIAPLADPAVAKLIVSIDEKWLADPARVFPVSIDPTLENAHVTDDAYVADTAPTTTFSTSEDRAGKAAGTNYRSFLHLPSLSALQGQKIVSASWYGYVSSFAGTSPVTITAKPVSGGWDPSTVNWNNQPAVRSNNATVSVNATGFVSANITTFVENWTKATSAWSQDGIRLHGPSNGSVYFASLDAPSAQQPYIEVTYTAYPTISDWGAGGRYFAGTVNSATPTLSVTIADVDSTSGLYGEFELRDAALSTPPIAAGAGASVASGQRSEFPVTTPLADGIYKWRVRGNDGEAQTAYTSWQTLTVDTTAPNPAAVTLPGRTMNTWGGASGAHFAGNGSTDIFGFVWGVDEGDTPSNFVAATSNAADVTLALSSGWHDLVARSVDRAGNLSASATHFTFGIGVVGFDTPASNFQAQRRIVVSAQSDPNLSALGLQYRRSESAAWQWVPAAHVTYADGGGAIGAWPVTTTPGSYSSVYPGLVWDARATAGLVDGPLQLRAVLYVNGSPWYYMTDAASMPIVYLNQDGFGSGFASVPGGPGDVNLLTGNLTLAAPDVALAGGSVSRTFESRQPAATGSVFGPGWVSNIGVGDSAFRSLTDNGDTVLVIGVRGDQVAFRKQTDGTYLAQDGSTDYTLRKVSSTRFELALFDFETFGFTNYDDQATALFVPSDVTNSTGQTANIEWDHDTDSGVTLPTQIVAPSPAGVNCVSSPLTTRGCQALTFDYATATGTTSACAGTAGDVAGQLRTVRFTAWDPDLATPAMRTVDVATYCYDTVSHRLMSEWDPRASPPLKVVYGYDSDGHVSSVTPPGQNPWTFTYAPLGSEPASTGRLSGASRVMPTSSGDQTATTRYVYEIPLTTAAGGPWDMDSSTTANWAQHDNPTDATAVFPPDQTPSGTPPAIYTRATTFYMNVEGQLVNVAEPGGQITTTEHDDIGNVIRTLSAANRVAALGPTLADSQVRYDADGINVTDTYGPAHNVVLPDGTARYARQHVHYTYDENAPGGARFGLLTTTTESAAPIDGSAEQDTRTTTNSYTVDGDSIGWDLGTPLRTTVDPGGLALATTTKYDPDTGQLTERWLPEALTDTANSDKYKTKFVYYTAGIHPTDSDCGNRPEWDQLPCKQRPVAQPGTPGMPDLPISQVTKYDMYGQPEEAKDQDTSGSTLRTTTVGYDSAGRPASNSVASTLGMPLNDIFTAYDPATGLPAYTIDWAGSQHIQRTYNSVGQLAEYSEYSDADYNTTTYTYDLLGRPNTINDGMSATTYGYNTSLEPRGLPTSITDSQAGTFTAAYDADGRLASQGFPGSHFVAIWQYDEIGEPTDLIYWDGCVLGCSPGTWPQFSATYDIHGQRRSDIGLPQSWTYDYDQAGRLTHSSEEQFPISSYLGGLCTDRTYGFDANTNRTSRTTKTGGIFGLPCPPPGPGTTTNPTYDPADRITTTGTTYDQLGRTTTIPATDSPHGQTTTVGYYTNDLVHTTTTSGGGTVTYNLDPNRRARTWSDTTGATHTNHYTGDGDSPAWTTENSAGTEWTRNVAGFNGIAAIVGPGGVTLQIANLHGDIIGTVTTTETDWLAGIDSGSATISTTSDYGEPVTNSRYDYLGTHQRQRDTNTGLQLMGARLYNPTTGRFLQTDPILGGSANNYDYADGNPVGNIDVSGTACESYLGGNVNLCLTRNYMYLYLSLRLTELLHAVLVGATLFGIAWQAVMNKIYVHVTSYVCLHSLFAGIWNYWNCLHDIVTGASSSPVMKATLRGALRDAMGAADFLKNANGRAEKCLVLGGDTSRILYYGVKGFFATAGWAASTFGLGSASYCDAGNKKTLAGILG